MTTTIIVEDGTIVAGSNSYVTVSGVTDYAADYGLTDWTASTVTDTIREQAIFKSMRYLEALNWKGTKYSADQNLEWPRSYVYDRNDYLIDDDTVPQAVINAQCEIAVLMLPDSDVDLQPTYTREDFLVESSIAGATTEKWNPNGATRRPVNTVIKDILKGLVDSSFAVPLERS
jgi:hypothetical protein